MKQILILPVLLLYFLSARAQENYDLSEAGQWEFVLPSVTSKWDGKLPFNSIEIKDFRFDSTKLGYIKRGGIKKIVVKNGVANGLTSFMNAYFKKNLDSSSGKTLVIVLRHLWLQEGSGDLDTDEKVVRQAPPGFFSDAGYGINFSDFEVYCKENNKYRALFKLNDEFVGAKYKAGKLDDLLFLSFDSLFAKIYETNIDVALSVRKEYTYEFISENYIKRFNLPILQDKTLNKGVYLTFKDFKNNKPTYTDYTVNTGKLTDALYVGDKLLTEFWGYCDGQNLFVKLGYNFFQLRRQNNTFDLYGAKHITNYNGVSNGSAYPNNPNTGVNQQMNYSTNTNKYVLRRKPLQVDMEEGDVY